MTWFDYCTRYQVPLSAQQVWAMHWLEMRGKRFLVDFGYANAVTLADVDVRKFYRM